MKTFVAGDGFRHDTEALEMVFYSPRESYIKIPTGFVHIAICGARLETSRVEVRRRVVVSDVMPRCPKCARLFVEWELS